MPIDWPDNEILRRWYWDDGLSQAAIADRLGCSPSAVNQKFSREGIKARPTSKTWPDRDTIHRWYWDEGMSTTEIAERLGRSDQGVGYHMEKLGIPRREKGAEMLDRPDAQTLRGWYEIDELTMEQIGERVGCGKATVSKKLEREGIEARDTDYTARYLDSTDRRFLRYTRWAVGETLTEFSARLEVSAEAYRAWESGRTNIGPEYGDRWELLVELGEASGISPDSPRRQMYWRQFLDVLGELLYKLDCTQERLADLIGIGEGTLSEWRSEKRRPYVGNHKAVRDLAELLGAWSPPEAVETIAEPETEPEAELSEQDVSTIAALYEAGTNPADLAMMYDITLRRVSDIVRGDRD